MIFNENTFKELLRNMVSYHNSMAHDYEMLMKKTFDYFGYNESYYHCKQESEVHRSLAVHTYTILNCFDKQKTFELWFDVYDPRNIKFKE